MLADALRRLLARLAAGDGGAAPDLPDLPELVELERRAAIAMTACTCGHAWHRHEHPYPRTFCTACGCERFRPAARPAVETAATRTSPARLLLIRLRVALWTRAWRDHRRV